MEDIFSEMEDDPNFIYKWGHPYEDEISFFLFMENNVFIKIDFALIVLMKECSP
jgi:hypothetical protein